ncbi:MAG: CBS domain-containing protein, partial [Anaerolineae bacterium]|nr:CBS domain-containing protein [Anaerolineae bacterium]
LRVNKVSQTESWFNHSVAEVMTRNVVTLSADRSVLFAWQQMLAHVIKVMPVMDVSGGVIGILTDEDLLERAGVRQRLSLALRLDENEIKHDLDMLADSPLKVRDVMSQPVVTIIETDLLRTAIEKMVKHGLKRLPVLNSQLHLVGMLSRLDILRQVTGLQPKSTGQGLPTGAARTVGQVMTADIPTVQQDECLPEIINKLVKYNHTRLIVVDGEGKAIGRISDADLISRMHPEKRSGILDALRRLIKPVNGLETAQDLMSPGVSMVGEDTRLVDAVQRMMDESRKWLVVVDQNVHPIGLLNRQILLESIAAYLRKTTQYQP